MILTRLMSIHKSGKMPVTNALVGSAMAATSLFSTSVHASPAISGGFWANYAYVNDAEGSSSDNTDDETFGEIASEALILYISDAPADKNYSFSGEIRFGPGAFTSPARNSSGDNFGLHKAEIGFDLDDYGQLIVGKTQVPFAFKTTNFWPGDMLLAGYGDQMDVGAKLSNQTGAVSYQIAYFHADDWGETSTDTMDDNGHWGASDTYRKVQTLVGDLSVSIADGHTLGASIQSGKLQDLTGTDPVAQVDGSHSAAALYYQGQFDSLGLKAEYLTSSRELPENYVTSASLSDDTFESDRTFIELTYSLGDWYLYTDATYAESDDVDSISAYAFGGSYNYGPGWIYLEMLTQDGWIGENNNLGEGDYTASYLTIDYYF